ncbi:MAG: SAF domain-containing protein, partial [Ignavibacteria bacterium]
LEKHFTFDKTLPGNDHYHAMDKEDLKNFFRELDRVFLIAGNFKKKALDSEDASIKNARRSLVSTKKIKEGEVISESQLTWKRPASGISPSEINNLIGKRAAEDIEEDTVLKWEMFI